MATNKIPFQYYLLYFFNKKKWNNGGVLDFFLYFCKLKENN